MFTHSITVSLVSRFLAFGEIVGVWVGSARWDPTFDPLQYLCSKVHTKSKQVKKENRIFGIFKPNYEVH